MHKTMISRSRVGRAAVTLAGAASLAVWLTAPGAAQQVPQGRLEDRPLPNVGGGEIQVLPV